MEDGYYTHNLEPAGGHVNQRPNFLETFLYLKERSVPIPYSPFVEKLLNALEAVKGQRASTVYIEERKEEWDARLLRKIFKYFKHPVFSDGKDGMYHLKDEEDGTAEILFIVKKGRTS